MEMGLIRWDLLFTFDPIVGYDFVPKKVKMVLSV